LTENKAQREREVANNSDRAQREPINQAIQSKIL
jgi:hypothetical protein